MGKITHSRGALFREFLLLTPLGPYRSRDVPITLTGAWGDTECRVGAAAHRSGLHAEGAGNMGVIPGTIGVLQTAATGPKWLSATSGLTSG